MRRDRRSRFARSGRRLLVHRHDRRAAEPDVVLDRRLRARDLPLVRGAAQLPGEFRALRESGCAERVALRDQAARWSPSVGSPGPGLT